MSLGSRIFTTELYCHVTATCAHIYTSTETRALRTNESRLKIGKQIGNIRQHEKRHKATVQTRAWQEHWDKTQKNENTRKYKHIHENTNK